MLLKRSSLAFLIYLASVAASSPLDTRASTWKAFEERAVSVPAVNSTAFEPPHVLLSISEKCAILNTGFNGIIATSGIVAAAYYVSQIIETQSDNHSCDLISGYVDGLHYQYSASGRNCDTTAELKTVNDAVQAATKLMAQRGVNDACFQLTHGGTWKGLLQLAAGSGAIIQNRCSFVAYTINV